MNDKRRFGYNAILQAQVSKFNFRIIQFSSRKDTSFSLFPFSLDFFFLLDKRISRANWYVSTRKRYNRQYVEHFICIRAEEMARTLMFLADASRKPFLYLPSFSSGDWSECVLRICQPPVLLSSKYPPTVTVTPWHTFPLPFPRIKSRGGE